MKLKAAKQNNFQLKHLCLPDGLGPNVTENAFISDAVARDGFDMNEKKIQLFCILIVICQIVY